MHTIRKGFHAVGIKDNEVVYWPVLLDAKTLMLTPNADTVYVMAFLDLTKGPMVLEVPPRVLGGIDDYWQRWVIDTGVPGLDRGEGGKYLIVPPGYVRGVAGRRIQCGPLPHHLCDAARAHPGRQNYPVVHALRHHDALDA